MQREITRKVLVLGVDERSTLTVVRSLGRKGIEVHLGYDDESSISGTFQQAVGLPSAHAVVGHRS